jgi:hypothetical protein
MGSNRGVVVVVVGGRFRCGLFGVAFLVFLRRRMGMVDCLSVTQWLDGWAEQ